MSVRGAGELIQTLQLLEELAYSRCGEIQLIGVILYDWQTRGEWQMLEHDVDTPKV